MKTLRTCITLGIGLSVPAMGMATLLNFDGLGLANYGAIPSSLGSYASSAVTGVAQGSAWTPNVGLSMTSVDGSANVTASNLSFWDTSYGDLTDIAFATQNGTFGRVTLTADAGYFVTINRFDLGGWPTADLAADRIRIYDSAGNVLWNQDGSTVVGNGPAHSSYAPAITGQTLVLEYGSNWNIGMDNLDFTQSTVPEPATLAVLGMGAAALLRRKRSRR